MFHLLFNCLYVRHVVNAMIGMAGTKNGVAKYIQEKEAQAILTHVMGMR